MLNLFKRKPRIHIKTAQEGTIWLDEIEAELSGISRLFAVHPHSNQAFAEMLYRIADQLAAPGQGQPEVR